MAAFLQLQILWCLYHAKSSSASFHPPGPGIPVCHVLSVSLQALTGPAQLTSPFSLFSHSTPSLHISVSFPSAIPARSKPSALYHSSLHLSRLPTSKLVSSQILLSWCFPAELWCFLVELSEFWVLNLTVWLFHSLTFLPSFCLVDVRRDTMDYAVTSLYQSLTPSCLIQVCSLLCFFFLSFFLYWCRIQ